MLNGVLRGALACFGEVAEAGLQSSPTSLRVSKAKEQAGLFMVSGCCAAAFRERLNMPAVLPGLCGPFFNCLGLLDLGSALPLQVPWCFAIPCFFL